MHKRKAIYYKFLIVCYFYDNGYDKGVSVFNEGIRDPLFTFDEAVNEKEIIFLLKGYELGVDH